MKFNKYLSLLPIVFCSFFLNQTLAVTSSSKASSSTLIKDSRLDSLKLDAHKLYRRRDYSSTVSFVDNVDFTKEVVSKSDSLNASKMFYFKMESEIKLNLPLESLESADIALSYFPSGEITEDSRQMISMIYYKKAYQQDKLLQYNKAEQSMLKAIESMKKIKAKKYVHLIIDGYTFLSTISTYFRNFKDSSFYLRMANTVFETNKDSLENVPPVTKQYFFRNSVLLPAKAIYLLTESAETTQDSLKIFHELDKLNEIESSGNLKKEYSIYYTRSLGAIGDWFINRKPDSLLNQKDLQLANNYIQRAIDLKRKKDYNIYYFAFNYNKSRVLTYQKKYNEAYDLINKLIDSIGNSDWGRNISTFYAQKALIEANLKLKDSSMNSFRSALNELHQSNEKLNEDYSNFKPSTIYSETELVLGIIKRLKKFYIKDNLVKKQIFHLYRAAFKQFENSYIDSRFSKSQNKTLRSILHGLIAGLDADIQADREQMKDILGRSESIMNRMSWKSFQQSRSLSQMPEMDSIYQRGVALRTQLVKAKRVENEKAQDSIRGLLNGLEIYLKSNHPNLALIEASKFSIDSLQSKLAKDEIIIKYILFEDAIAIIKIGQDDINWELASWSKKDEQTIQLAINSVNEIQFKKDNLNGLSQLLIPNFEKDYRKLIINPDGILNRLPFEILMDNTDYLINSANISYTSNLAFIFSDKSPVINQDNILGIYAPRYPKGNQEFVVRSKPVYLEGAVEESNSIKDIFDSQIYNSERLSKYDFIETSKNKKLLHLAMHAQIDKEKPALSKLLFSNNSSDEDDLYLEELYGLNLNGSLAVLSACNTGIGAEDDTQIMESFQRAFTFAGISSTVASLWEVPDLTTRDIMVEFYSNLKKGQKKSEALKNAKLKFISENKGTKFEQPYYWAGFVLYGSDAPVATAVMDNKAVFLLVFGGITLIFGIWLFFRNKKSVNL